MGRPANTDGLNLDDSPIELSPLLPQLEDAIVGKIQEHWADIGRPRALVFCKTVDSADRMAAAINARGFARAEVLSSKTGADNRRIDREIKLMRFENGEIDILCGWIYLTKVLMSPMSTCLYFCA